MDMDSEEKKPLDAPAEKEGEKKDAGAQADCGLSYTLGCGMHTMGMTR